MAQYQITLDLATLHQLFRGGAGESGMKTLLETVLNQVLQAQARLIFMKRWGKKEMAIAIYRSIIEKKSTRPDQYQ